jgi:hypothetical protein
MRDATERAGVTLPSAEIVTLASIVVFPSPASAPLYNGLILVRISSSM